jgi:hypothetical protein
LVPPDWQGILVSRYKMPGNCWQPAAREPEESDDDDGTIQIELPESTAQAALATGLLTSEALDRVLMEAIRSRQAADALLSIADRVGAPCRPAW